MEDCIMAYIKNLTDKNQSEREAAANSGGITVQQDGKQRVVAKALHTAPYKTANNGGTGGERNNAGVVMPPADRPGKFENPGKA
jgi:hypothetical protein